MNAITGIKKFLDNFVFRGTGATIVNGEVPPEWKLQEAISKYKGWVYDCVSTIAEKTSFIDLHLYKMEGEDLAEIDEHELLSLLTQPNRFQTGQEFMEATVGFYKLTGEFFWYTPRYNDGTIGELWCLRPDRMQIHTSEQKYIVGYSYLGVDGTRIPFEFDEIIHAKSFNPTNEFRGMSPVLAKAVAVDTDEFSAKWNRNFFYNNAKPAGILTTEKTLSDKSFTRIKREWEEKYKGVENAHQVAILEGGLDWKDLTPKQHEMEFLQLRGFGFDEIRSAFKVPKILLGLEEGINRATAEASEQVFALNVLVPMMQKIVGTINNRLIPSYGKDTKVTKGLWFDFDNPVPDDQEKTVIKYQRALEDGWMTINEVREEEGLEPVDGGDVIMIAFNKQPLGGNTDIFQNQNQGRSKPDDNNPTDEDPNKKMRKKMREPQMVKQPVLTILEVKTKKITEQILPKVKTLAKTIIKEERKSVKKKDVVKDEKSEK